MSEINTILDFWFGEIKDGFTIEDRNGFWFMPNEGVDKTIKDKFGDLVAEAGGGKLKKWGSSPRGSLALIILLDQFTRNIYRGFSEAFQYDNDARRICNHGIKDGTDTKLEIIERCFYYLPLEHSENIEDQQLCLDLLKRILGSNIEKHRDKIEDAIYYADKHKQIIEKFGRFPHRNKILKRESTREELDFLLNEGINFGQ